MSANSIFKSLARSFGSTIVCPVCTEVHTGHRQLCLNHFPWNLLFCSPSHTSVIFRLSSLTTTTWPQSSVAGTPCCQCVDPACSHLALIGATLEQEMAKLHTVLSMFVLKNKKLVVTCPIDLHPDENNHVNHVMVAFGKHELASWLYMSQRHFGLLVNRLIICLFTK